MSKIDESDVQGALVVRPEEPLRGRFTVWISDSFCFEATESGNAIRLDFRPRTLQERVLLWKRKWGL